MMLQDFILRRLREPSTYAGFSGLAVTFGISQPLYSAATTLIAAICGLAAVLLSERKA